jgi:hypothetical protein
MTMNPLPDKITIEEKYGPAMSINDEQEAQEYFELCVEHTMRFGKSRVEAEEIERKNLGYYAGYYNSETRARVERLFNCAHPFFGAIAEKGLPTPEEICEMGYKLGRDGRSLALNK